MKKTIFLAFTATVLVVFAVNAQNLPYNASYSSNFKVGNHDLSKMVLSLYKDYEKNDFETHLGWFADTVMAQLPDGHMLRGKGDVIDYFKNERQTIGDMTFSMDAIIPLTSVDRKETWVALWGSSDTQQGKQDFQAIWRLNKDKKVDFMKIFTAQSPQQ